MGLIVRVLHKFMITSVMILGGGVVGDWATEWTLHEWRQPFLTEAWESTLALLPCEDILK